MYKKPPRVRNGAVTPVTPPTRILIVGGGHVGLCAALRLHQRLRPDEAEVTLVDRARTHLWKPLLHEVAAGSMDLDAAFAALPGLTRRSAQRHMAEAVATALEAPGRLLVHAPTGVGKSIGYLVPIVAAGRRAISRNIPSTAAGTAPGRPLARTARPSAA